MSQQQTQNENPPPPPSTDQNGEKQESKMYNIPQPLVSDINGDDLQVSDMTPRKKRVGHLAAINDHIVKLEDKHYKCNFPGCSYTPQLNATRVRKHILKCHPDSVPADIPINYYSPPPSPLGDMLTQHVAQMPHHIIQKDPKYPDSFQVCVQSDSLHFSAAHFIAYKGYREKLHGHNYTISLAMKGDVGSDGYVMNFTDLKKAMKQICAELDHKVIIPILSDVLVTIQGEINIDVSCEDGSKFVFPKGDCVCIPIIHSSVEEIGKYLTHKLIEMIGREQMRNRKIQTISMCVAEAPTQYATYTIDI